MSGSFLKLADVLVRIKTFPWNHALYLPDVGEWTLDSLGAVLDPNDCDDDQDDVPVLAAESNLTYAFGIQQVQDVVDFALRANPDASAQDLLSALIYYRDNDAFALSSSSTVRS